MQLSLSQWPSTPIRSLFIFRHLLFIKNLTNYKLQWRFFLIYIELLIYFLNIIKIKALKLLILEKIVLQPLYICWNCMTYFYHICVRENLLKKYFYFWRIYHCQNIKNKNVFQGGNLKYCYFLFIKNCKNGWKFRIYPDLFYLKLKKNI